MKSHLPFIIIMIGIFGSVIVSSINTIKEETEANYKICALESKNCYYAESYTKEENCVFIAEKELRICGNYTIKKLITKQ